MKLQLETLTVVSIGSGEALSQFSDYVYDRGFVYYLDSDRLSREIAARADGEELIERFIAVVRQQAGGSTQERYNLKQFLIEQELDYQQFTFRKVAVRDEVKEAIQLQVKTGDAPYIPGSSLKGAIRTAVLGRFCDESFFNQAPLKLPKDYIGKEIFGDIRNDVFRYLSVSDTQPFDSETLGIYRFYRLAPQQRQQSSSIPIVKEAVAPRSVTTFDLKSKAHKGEVADRFSFLHDGAERTVFKLLNQSTLDNLRLELLYWEKESQDKAIADFYQNLLSMVEKADHASEAFLRIGSGKTFFDNTIARQLSPELLEQIIKKSFNKANPKFFPKTRTLASDGPHRQAPGWVRISIKGE